MAAFRDAILGRDAPIVTLQQAAAISAAAEAAPVNPVEVLARNARGMGVPG
ncbi:hypothetical protein KBX50_28295 [Micromonospora sp. C51]|uniref:hypothetical protein n=1 Tax=Micromonospora sp. C51 TaxID=2824879 RepID=UPI001B39606F|nr:hypothetical protein [Micromonospora sp. C51]MBQ1052342.1 hypothetical protein [Micromonospora sp. C51]